jgi:hypothetical protein
MKKYTIPPEVVSEAIKLANCHEAELEKYGGCTGHAVRGKVGEIITSLVLQAKMVDHFNYDLVTTKGYKVDVKTTMCRSEPKDYYEVNIVSPNMEKFEKDPPDYFVFVRILEDCSVCWICGYMSSQEFFERAIKTPKGESRGHKTFERGDGLSIAIKDLKPIGEK